MFVMLFVVCCVDCLYWLTCFVQAFDHGVGQGHASA